MLSTQNDLPACGEEMESADDSNHSQTKLRTESVCKAEPGSHDIELAEHILVERVVDVIANPVQAVDAVFELIG